MALIPCPHCSKQISDRARACPHCKAQLSAPSPCQSSEAADPIVSSQRIPMGPVVLGVLTILNGFLSALILALSTAHVWIHHALAEPVTLATCGIGTILSAIQLAAGIGVLLHHRWSVATLQQLTVGVVLNAGVAFGHAVLTGAAMPADSLVVAASLWPFCLHFLLKLPFVSRHFPKRSESKEPMA